MSFDTQRLYELMPTIYRIRDAEHNERLRALLSVIAEQIAVLEENLEQLYDDQFIETSSEWVVPYIGDLIGYRSLYNQVAPKILSQRAEVAHTIAFRRRKGTASMLEQLARDVTGWNARVVEFFQILAWTQYMNHTRPTNWYAPDMRLWEPLERLGTAFDTIAHTVDVRHISAGHGWHNIPNIGIFLWRLNAYPLTKSPAFKLDKRRYFFNPLGHDAPLFTRPESEDEITHLAEPINTPTPISRRVLNEYFDLHYGPDKSIYLNGIDPKDVAVCDLTDWIHKPPAGKIVAIDPVLGRIAFAADQSDPPEVTFHYGFSADMGGGEYEREGTFDALLTPVKEIPTPPLIKIQDALDDVESGGVVEISDSGRYVERPSINVDADKKIELRAGNNNRPTLDLDNGNMLAKGEELSEVTINGLLITGGKLRVPNSDNKLRRLRLCHCTIVPRSEPNLLVELDGVAVEINHCIVGGLRIPEGAQAQITDSIVDATDRTEIAFADVDNSSPGGTLRIVDSTVIGEVLTTEMSLASNVIFLSEVTSERKQKGCVRFSYLPLDSVVPRRYRCQPTNAEDSLKLIPRFTSLCYGDPGYCQLSQRTAVEIRTGADDESEMGTFHDLYQSRRETNLRVRLEEYLRFGLEAGIIYAT